MRYIRLVISAFFSFLILPFCLTAKTISPLDYGLGQALTGEERFEVINRTHKMAKKYGWKVSYEGIEKIEIEIPARAKSIELGENTDFCGVTFMVTNTKNENYFLFELSKGLQSINISKSRLDSYDFRGISELNRGYMLLVIEDENPWVENRSGYSYGAIRRDVLLLKRGHAQNKTIAPYNNQYSSPKCFFVKATKGQKSFKNITFYRTHNSTQKTFLVKVSNMNNVLLQGIQIITPKPITMDGDSAISIHNCTNINFKDIFINQTYSSENAYGYGILMNNVWNSCFDHFEGEAAWGLFGNNNINTAHINNSTINRFDNHCYGRDFYFLNCEFTQYGLPQSSFVGVAVFTNCIFKYATICLARTEYNAFSPFAIELNGCTIYLNKSHRHLLNLGRVSKTVNSRKELQEKVSPSLSIKNSTIILSDDVPSWSLIHVSENSEDNPFDLIGDINIEGLQVKGYDASMMVFDRQIVCRNPVSISLSGVNLFTNESVLYSQAQKKYNYTPTILFNINRDREDTFLIKNSKLNYNPIEFPHFNVRFSGCFIGRIRFYNTDNGKVSSRRRYENCTIYLNDIDSNYYTLDDNADYISCRFIATDKRKKMAPYSMNKKSVIYFQNCKSDNMYFHGHTELEKKTILKSYYYRF